MLTILPSRRRIVVLLGLLIALPSGIVGAFALTGTGMAVIRLFGGANTSLRNVAWGAFVGSACLALTAFAVAMMARQFEHPDAPVTLRSSSDPNPPRIRSMSREITRFGTSLIVVWMLAWIAGAAAAAARNWDRPGDWLWVLVLALIAAIPAPPIWRIVRANRRTPDAWLELRPGEPSRGAPLVVRFTFDSIPAPGVYRVVLQVFETREAYDSRPTTQGWHAIRGEIWSASVEATPRGTALECVLTPSDSVPASNDAGKITHSWEVGLHYPGEPVPRRFSIAVR